MSFLRYDILVTPREPTLNLELSLGKSATTERLELTVTIADTSSFSIAVTPAAAASFMEKVLSFFAKPIADLLVTLIPDVIKGALKGKTVATEIGASLGYTIQNVNGVDITVGMESPKLSMHQGMLMIDGTIKVN